MCSSEYVPCAAAAAEQMTLLEHQVGWTTSARGLIDTRALHAIKHHALGLPTPCCLHNSSICCVHSARMQMRAMQIACIDSLRAMPLWPAVLSTAWRLWRWRALAGLKTGVAHAVELPCGVTIVLAVEHDACQMLGHLQKCMAANCSSVNSCVCSAQRAPACIDSGGAVIQACSPELHSINQHGGQLAYSMHLADAPLSEAHASQQPVTGY